MLKIMLITIFSDNKFLISYPGLPLPSPISISSRSLLRIAILDGMFWCSSNRLRGLLSTALGLSTLGDGSTVLFFLHERGKQSGFLEDYKFSSILSEIYRDLRIGVSPPGTFKDFNHLCVPEGISPIELLYSGILPLFERTPFCEELSQSEIE
jgi:hypothetical protein